MKSVLLWLWQLPQNIIGFIISRFCTRHYELSADMICYCNDSFFNSAVSLGDYIVIDISLLFSVQLRQVLRHEHGHQMQSLYLGPLYLIVIGLPSLCGNIYDRIFHRDWEKLRRESWYYSRFPENWADRLGGVKR